MKKYFFTAVLIGAFGAISAQEIQLNKQSVDFGLVNKNAKNAISTLIVTNGGNAPLEILSIKPSCTCIVPIFDRSSIAPGKQKEIKINLNTSEAGPFQHEITIHSNAKNAANKTIAVKGEVFLDEETQRMTK